MKKELRIQINIDCDNEKCGNCRFINDLKCGLFNVFIDHIVGEPSCIKRCNECIKAEVKE